MKHFLRFFNRNASWRVEVVSAMPSAWTAICWRHWNMVMSISRDMIHLLCVQMISYKCVVDILLPVFVYLGTQLWRQFPILQSWLMQVSWHSLAPTPSRRRGRPGCGSSSAWREACSLPRPFWGPLCLTCQRKWKSRYGVIWYILLLYSIYNSMVWYSML